MAENTNNTTEQINNEVEKLLNDDKVREETTMTKAEKVSKWFEKNGPTLAFVGFVATVFGATIVASVAESKATAKDKAEDRRLAEKWMDTQLEVAKIEADAEVRRKTAVTNDIAEIVKTVAKQ